MKPTLFDLATALKSVLYKVSGESRLVTGICYDCVMMLSRLRTKGCLPPCLGTSRHNTQTQK